jgi:hypothetical protein
MTALENRPFAPVDHTPVPVLPSTLHLPNRPPKLIYLDLNHWVNLSKANSGHAMGGAYRDVLDACIAAVESGKAVFPISDSIYMEVLKIGPHRQRRQLREVIERVGRFVVVTSRVVIAEHEIESLLDRLVGPDRKTINDMGYLDWGAFRAFGMVGGLRIHSIDTDEDVTDKARAEFSGGPAEFDRRLAIAELEANRMLLEGPLDEDKPRLQAEGWDPRAAYEVAERRAEQERQEALILDANPDWRTGRLRDVIRAREILIEINEMLFRACSARRVPTSLEALFASPEEARGALDSMPSFDVAVSMKTEYHRNGQHTWKRNDIQDIDALASTVPYCDVVATDTEGATLALRAGLGTRHRTVILSRTTDLPDHF